MDQLEDGDCLCVPRPKHSYGARLGCIYTAMYFNRMDFQNATEKARDFHGIAHVFAKPVLLLHCYSIVGSNCNLATFPKGDSFVV